MKRNLRRFIDSHATLSELSDGINMGSSNSNDLEDNILELLDWTDAESTSGIWLTRSLSQCLTDTKSRSRPTRSLGQDRREV